MHLLLTYSVDFHRAAPWDKCYPLSGGISTGILSELDKFRGKAAHKLSLKHSLAKLTGFPWRQHFNDDTPKKKIRQKKLNKRKLATFLLIHNSFIVRGWCSTSFSASKQTPQMGSRTPLLDQTNYGD